MAFVKTAEEIAAIEKVLATPRFTGARRAHLSFLTTPEFVEQVLPQCRVARHWPGERHSSR